LVIVGHYLLRIFRGKVSKKVKIFTSILARIAVAGAPSTRSGQAALESIAGPTCGNRIGTADHFISTTDKPLQEQLKQLHVTLLNLKVVTTYAKALVETLAEKPNRVIFSGKPAKLSHPRRKF